MHILVLGTNWNQGVTFMLQLLYVSGRGESWHPLSMGPQSWFGILEKRKMSGCCHEAKHFVSDVEPTSHYTIFTVLTPPSPHHTQIFMKFQVNVEV
jgi:hypothetical protein